MLFRFLLRLMSDTHFCGFFSKDFMFSRIFGFLENSGKSGGMERLDGVSPSEWGSVFLWGIRNHIPIGNFGKKNQPYPTSIYLFGTLKMTQNIWCRESGRKMPDPFSAVGRVKFSLDQIFFDGIRGSDPVQSFGNAHPPHRLWFVGLITKCAGTPQKRTTYELSVVRLRENNSKIIFLQV